MPFRVIGPCRRRASRACHLACVAAGLPAENAQSRLLRCPQMRKNAASALATSVVLPMRIDRLSLGLGRPLLVQALGARLPSSTILPARSGKRLAYVGPKNVP